MRASTPATQQALGRVIGRLVEARARQDNRPFVIGHLVTNRCNCRCPSCLWRHNDWRDVPLDELKRFYAEAKAEGFVATALSGGAPFLRKDLGALVRYIKQDLGMPILLFTTGWFLTRRMDEVIPHIDMLVVSLDSARAERHDRIRGLAGLYDRLIAGVRLVRSRYPELSLQFNCCVQRGIADEIDELIALAESLDVHISFDVITEYRHGDSGQPSAQTEAGLPPDELRAVCRTLLDRKRAGAPIVNSERYFEYFVDGRPGYRCHLPKVVMFVDGRGDVEHCLNLNQPLGNITQTPLREIMRHERFKQLRVAAEGCSSCNSPTMVDLSTLWENPLLAFQSTGIKVR
ncbi:MAG: radical SAM protein [Myxococcales bacterium]|nr:radical SAM protein [Myxococcales bacterium]